MKKFIFLVVIILAFSAGCTDMPGDLENSLNGVDEGDDTVTEEDTATAAEDVTCISISDINEQDRENVNCFSIPDLGMEFVRIPAGTFMMGDLTPELAGESDETPHAVTHTQDYYIQSTEVTQAQWRLVMAGTELENPSYFKGCDNCPVEFVTWFDVVNNFLPRLNEMFAGQYDFRLPTEAQWERAARAGSTTRFCFGDSLSPDQANYNWNFGNPTEVKSFPPNRWGLYDMHGNLWEWCSDWYGDYEFNSPTVPVEDPIGPPTGDDRVVRGGSWDWDADAELCRSANRGWFNPGKWGNNVGLRLCFQFIGE